MASAARIVRQDRVEIFRDRGGRMPAFVPLKERGTLVLIEEGDRRTVLLTREGHPDLSAALADVRGYGPPRGTYGIKAVGERALRVGFGTERLIVAFTGEIGDTDLDGSLADLQLDRLSGDFDLLGVFSSVRELWRNRGAWKLSREAAQAWGALLPKGHGNGTKPRTARAPATHGGAGVGARYSEEFRQQAVATARASDASMTAVARELEISPTTLRRWVDQSR